jgi:hypothetical protein
MQSSETVASVALILLALPLLRLRSCPELLLPTLYLVCGIGLVVLFDLVRTSGHMKFVRYVLVATPGAYLVVAGLLADKRGWIRHVLPAAVLLSCALSLPRAYSYYSPVKANWRDLMAAAGPHMRPNDAVIITYPNPSQYLAMSYYAPMPRRVVVLTGPLGDEAVAALGSPERVWVIGEQHAGHRLAPLTGDVPAATFFEPYAPPITLYHPRAATTSAPSTSPTR